MEIGNLANQVNLPKIVSSPSSQAAEQPNAFGIGVANKPEVELSAQARILQQNERTVNERREASSGDTDQDPSQDTQGINSDYVRVSSSVGSAASNNLSAEKATEIYQSIQDLL